MSSRSTQSTSRSSPGLQASSSRNAEQQTYLQQQRLNTYMGSAEPWQNGRRVGPLPYQSVVTEAPMASQYSKPYQSAATEASRLSQGPPLVGLPEDLRGVGSWTASQGGK